MLSSFLDPRNEKWAGARTQNVLAVGPRELGKLLTAPESIQRKFMQASCPRKWPTQLIGSVAVVAAAAAAAAVVVVVVAVGGGGSGGSGCSGCSGGSGDDL